MENSKVNPKKPAKAYKFTKTQLKWLEALESGEYKRTEGILCKKIKNGDYRYCCLGVASEILLSDKYKAWSKNMAIFECKPGIPFEYRRFDGEDTDCPTSVMEKLKLHGSLGEFFKDGEEYLHEFTVNGTVVESYSLAELNDEGWSFKKIANFIRKNPRLVFRN